MKPRGLLVMQAMLVLTSALAIAACGKSGNNADGGTDGSVNATESETGVEGTTDPAVVGWTEAPVTPAAVECGADLWCEGECCHICVTPSCEDGWCRVPAGCFIYGSPPDEPGHAMYGEIETPIELLQDIVIQQYEMTRGQWAELGLPVPTQGPYCGDNIGVPCMDANCPVDAVNWWESLEAANRLSIRHGLAKCYDLVGCTGAPGAGMVCDEVHWPYSSIYECPGYRLPTFAEREMAIRAGTRTPYYSGGMSPIPPEDGLGYIEDPNLDRIAWYVWNSNNTSHPVGLKEPNAWNLFDMSGNVLEWLWDRRSGLGFHGKYQLNPVDWITTLERHTPASGAFWAPTINCRSAAQFEASADTRCYGVGLRLVRSVTWAEGADTDTDVWVDPAPDPCEVEPSNHDVDDCPLNSGWPCSCNMSSCEDGSLCISRTVDNCQEWEFGVCMPSCIWDGSVTCPGSEFSGAPECTTGFISDHESNCVLTCETEADCPSDQVCYEFDSQNACYPYP